jgi:putative ABC transport system permease protein
MWTPPGRTQAIPVFIEISSNPSLVLLTVAGLTVVASLSALVPATRASRLEVTEALRHA